MKLPTTSDNVLESGVVCGDPIYQRRPHHFPLFHFWTSTSFRAGSRRGSLQADSEGALPKASPEQRAAERKIQNCVLAMVEGKRYVGIKSERPLCINVDNHQRWTKS